MNRKQQQTRTQFLIALSIAAVTGGCTMTPWPGDTGSTWSSSSSTPTASTGSVPAGYYRVNSGDTVGSVAAAFGQRPQDISTWNVLPANASLIVGQVLRVAPPSTSAYVPPARTSGTPGTPGAAVSGAQVAAPSSATPEASSVTLIWPLRGPILRTFAAGKTNGIVIGGKAGDPVKAAAAGRVVYAGNGIPAYGPLVIIKHDSSVITAYGQNRTLLVKEGDAVSQGQTIGEVGTDPQGVASIQFEVRLDGHPVDPLAWLPKSGG
ncbi:peptidoglycan DD-metalloendopeptidase family protein [Paraburkholderia flava]|uniref:peptidoglycan DD-metalloendopeptidase family protein n=1 Tax=Paraburkholderia flava TaxID=2547393 RepID=UPI00105ED28E|nr:peptidoglycan DD-metalloendopeptidase family protein [Paraburkholderia flava]